jgi:phospholipid N-methyltransferase
MPSALADYRVFLKQFVSRYHTTGAVLPSGRWLAAALCRYVENGPSRKRVLEVGPGTGAVTAQIIRQLGATDRLTLVELYDDFVRRLRHRFECEPPFQTVSDRCELIHGRLEEVFDAERFDFIVSGLPLNNFAVTDVQRILDIFSRLLKPGGVLSFFEYIAIRQAKAVVSRGEDRKRLHGLSQVLGEFLQAREFRRDWVWLNVPPAWVHHVRIDS